MKPIRKAEKMNQMDQILEEMKKRGFRITNQRKIVIQVILNEDCDSCKEIIMKASKIDKSIGAATVYRVINLLEDCNIIQRRNMFRIEHKMVAAV